MSFFIDPTQIDRMTSTWTVIRVRLFVLRWLFRGLDAHYTSTELLGQQASERSPGMSDSYRKVAGN